MEISTISFTVTPIYIGLNILLALALAWQVVAERRKGDEADQEVIHHRQRVHANLVEYAPMALMMFAALELMGLDKPYVHAFNAIFFIARLAHAQGYGSSIGFTPGRFYGTLTTWITMAVASLTGIVLAIL
ncbi:MAG: MAPEG family protein [Alphaproteobacteria bacterium]